MKLKLSKDIASCEIYQLREYLRRETKEVKRYLGITVADLTKDLPIRNRDFDIWIGFTKQNQIIGFISFKVDDDCIAFIKSIYIVPEFRQMGYGIQLVKELLNKYSKVECRINEGNNSMYKLAKSVGLKGEKRSILLSNNSKSPSIWWSNYKSESDYKRL